MAEQVQFSFLVKQEISFVLRSVCNFLEEKGYKTDKRDISVRELSKIDDFPLLFVAEAELLQEYTESRVYLYDSCIEKGAKLVLIGDSDNLAELMDVTNPSIVAGKFERPINAREVVDELEKILEKIIAAGQRKKVLIVDDSATFLRTASEWLEKDYNVNICPSATAAFHMIETNRPDLILLDYEMPVCNGSQFLEMLHSEMATSNIPVIFLTSKNDPATVREVVSLKPQGYLLKTQPKEKILESIEEFFIREKGK